MLVTVNDGLSTCYYCLRLNYYVKTFSGNNNYFKIVESGM